MSIIYTHKMKQKLADRIAKIKNKDNMVNIVKIIYEDNRNISENQNGIFMLFDTLSNDTYIKLNDYLNSINTTKKKKIPNKIEYKSYASNNFSNEDSVEYQINDQFDNKLKYSNTEKSIIKRNIYNKKYESEENSNIIYTDFDVSATESETSEKNHKTLSEKNPKTLSEKN